MKLLHKSILVILIVTLLVLLICYDIHKTRAIQIENFQNDFQTTIITGFDPNEGDSSSTVTIRGKGLDFIEEVTFNDVECVILENRNDGKLSIIPPALSELNITIEEVRKSIDENGTGVPVQVKLMKKGGGKTPETAILLPDVVFYYIDKGANWKNQCPEPKEEEEEPVITESPATEPMIDASVGEASFKEGTDLYFLHVTIPEMENRLKKLYEDMKHKLDEQKRMSPELNDVNKLKLIQSMDSLNQYKQKMNILRYNIHNTISEKYN